MRNKNITFKICLLCKILRKIIVENINLAFFRECLAHLKKNVIRNIRNDFNSTGKKNTIFDYCVKVKDSKKIN